MSNNDYSEANPRPPRKPQVKLPPFRVFTVSRYNPRGTIKASVGIETFTITAHTVHYDNSTLAFTDFYIDEGGEISQRIRRVFNGWIDCEEQAVASSSIVQ